MCDYSLQSVKSRPAVKGEKLITHRFGGGTTGFASVDDKYGEEVAVCLLPGTEVAFEKGIQLGYYNNTVENHLAETTGRFRQINTECQLTHHDALELPDGSVHLLHAFSTGQVATVLQLPAAPRNEVEEKEQRRLEVTG